MAIDRDPVIWNDLLSFKPERFLDSCLDIKGNNFDYMPSGAGRKIFPGQPFGYEASSIYFGIIGSLI